MKSSLVEISRSLLRFLRFVLCYALAIYTLFHVLPWAAVLLQAQYDSLGAATRFAIVGAVLLPIIVALVSALRSRELVPNLSEVDRKAHG